MTSQNVQPGSPSDPMAAARQIADNMTRASMGSADWGPPCLRRIEGKAGKPHHFHDFAVDRRDDRGGYPRR